MTRLDTDGPTAPPNDAADACCSELPLGTIDAALDRGEFDTARQLADGLLRDCALPEDELLAARARLRLACCDFAESRVQRAHAKARQAAQALRESVHSAEEVDAFALCAQTASVRGRAVEAVETALLATHLADELPAGLSTARAYNSLGLAYGWSRAFAQPEEAFEKAEEAFEKAEEAFEKAAQLVGRHAAAMAQWEASVARSWVHAIRCFDEGRRAERGAISAALEQLSDRHAGIDQAKAPAISASLSTAADLVYGLLSLWSGRRGDAAAAMERCTAAGPSMVGWLLPAQSWLAAELALDASDLVAASMHATRMAALAAEVEHLPLECLGHGLAGDFHARQGAADLALAAKNRQLLCERAMRAHDLEGCAEIASMRMQARRGHAQIKELADKSMKFEREAHEDALTGIANLRRFNQCLTEWSATSAERGQPLCVALIDVDRFRDINNDFSYEVGNEALRGIAAEMVAHVRSTDLPARWGGDEFAILFKDTDRQTAELVASRIQEAVRQRDWSSVSQGLAVSVSVGVTEARAGDTTTSLIARSEDLMYAQKVARKKAEVIQAVAPQVLGTVVEWLRSAQRVVVFVGARRANETNPGSQPGDPLSSVTDGRRAFRDVRGFKSTPSELWSGWNQWRRSQQGRQPSQAHIALVALAHHLPEVVFVTERIDGVLAMAGATNTFELYGNAFRWRCTACGRVNPSVDAGRCLPCGTSTPMRPDIVLVGEHVDGALLAGAEWAMKRASVILVVDSDGDTHPGSDLIKKGRARGAKVVVLGARGSQLRGVADVSIDTAPEVVISALAQALTEDPTESDGAGKLSDDGFAVLCFLTGQRSDTLGFTLDQVIAWKDWEIATHGSTIPWLFPLTTRSAVNPFAPIPSRSDFAVLATNEQVRNGMRRAFLLMLRFYGFEWRDGEVAKAEGWRNGFSIWAVSHSPHDLYISRILGALRLMGLQANAERFLKALEVEVRTYRGQSADMPLWHWRLAVKGSAAMDAQGTA